ncbi:protein-L-isoaspartate(D-aspartate) O-methyltransferase [Mesorhizobium sp. NBSH29]|uniref:protein-L-isoaspartate(D-aspartate) O-methyltransferase n=1 Tax=Mesorhizobium sp. NBSH29 TaxID=2654249 RepID=UPI00189642AA|nr:protein-L-isoaspartate(D-aspartate) O-methyltransferase [Mesorhizobium sp. NBSH29]QPC87567.1 protein-L-isoaspartate(D-aspartate) O-methyltransferase [Mesorhizobium sp. NBSH29]
MNSMVDEREGFAAFLLRLRALGIPPKDLVSAMEATPRKLFVPASAQALAWSDRTLPIECGEAIEGVDLQAAVIAALEIEPGHRVLEIGTGSGFTAAVMARLAARVVTVDRYKTLVTLATQRFSMLGITNAFARQADGLTGLPGEGPFDRIVVWAAFEALPRGFVDQLATNGIMIAPIGPSEDEQQLAKLVKTGSRFEREDIATVRLQPLVKGTAAVL